MRLRIIFSAPSLSATMKRILFISIVVVLLALVVARSVPEKKDNAHPGKGGPAAKGARGKSPVGGAKGKPHAGGKKPPAAGKSPAGGKKPPAVGKPPAGGKKHPAVGKPPAGGKKHPAAGKPTAGGKKHLAGGKPLADGKKHPTAGKTPPARQLEPSRGKPGAVADDGRSAPATTTFDVDGVACEYDCPEFLAPVDSVADCEYDCADFVQPGYGGVGGDFPEFVGYVEDAFAPIYDAIDCQDGQQFDSQYDEAFGVYENENGGTIIDDNCCEDDGEFYSPYEVPSDGGYFGDQIVYE